jgi:hypothetical protein
MDREGGVWVGLQSNGLARLRTRQLSTISAEDGLPDDRTRAVFEDSAAISGPAPPMVSPATMMGDSPSGLPATAPAWATFAPSPKTPTVGF